MWLGIVPMAAIVLTIAMITPVIGDMIYKMRHGDYLAAIILPTYIAIGAIVYATYGYRHSRLNRESRGPELVADPA